MTSPSSRTTGKVTSAPRAGGGFDPFAHLSDEPAPSPSAARDDLLAAARRGWVPLRKVFVQRPAGEEERGSVLATLVTNRLHRPFNLLVLAHALQPILPGSPLELRTWARLLSTRSVCTPAAASRAFDTLEDLDLLRRSGTDRTPTIELLLEDGKGESWTKAGQNKEPGKGYYVLPHEYWTNGFADLLDLPGKAMLHILLAETQNPATPAFAMAVERAKAWYGLSERTAERGYNELHRAGILQVTKRKVADPRHPAGRRDVYWRALSSPFTTVDRQRLQAAARTAATKSGSTGSTPGGTTSP